MKITKETIERLIEEVKDYDQDTGIHEIMLILNPSYTYLSREYSIYIHTKESLVEIKIYLFNAKDSVKVSVSIEGGKYYSEFDPLDLVEEPFSLPSLLRTLVHLAVEKEKDLLTSNLKAFNDIVLYED